MSYCIECAVRNWALSKINMFKKSCEDTDDSLSKFIYLRDMQLLKELLEVVEPKRKYEPIQVENVAKLKIPISQALDNAIKRFCEKHHKEMMEYEKRCCEEENKSVKQNSLLNFKGET